MEKKRPAKLSPTFVKNVNKPGRYGDGHGGHGLSLLVKRMKNGRPSKTWSQRLNVKGTSVTRGLGSFPVVSLAMAREKALDNATRVARGEDIRKPQRVVPTVNEAFEAYITASSPSWRGRGTKNRWRRSQWYCRSIGSMLVSEVTSSDVRDVITPLWHKKNETAQKVRSNLSSVMKSAVTEGYRVTDPATPDITRHFGRRSPQDVKHHPSLHFKDVGVAMAAIRDSNGWWAVKAALMFLALTGVRSGNVREAACEEVDLESENPIWHIPATKNGYAHDVPLSTQAVEILLYAEERTGRSQGIIFPPQRGGQCLSDAVLSNLMSKLKIEAVPHGFRSSFRNWAAEKRKDHYASEKALAHVVSKGTEAAYLTTDFLELRAPIMQEWADYLTETMGPVVPTTSGLQ